jgi:hypothetical protein
MTKNDVSKKSPVIIFSAVFLSLALLAAGVSATVYAQSNLDFLANTPVSNLSKDQLNSLYEAIKASLNTGVSGKSSTWHSGAEATPAATITPHFDEKNRKCAVVDMTVNGKGQSQTMKLPYCQSQKGEWVLHDR